MIDNINSTTYIPFVIPEKNLIKVFKTDSRLDNSDVIYTFSPDGSASFNLMGSDIASISPAGVFLSLFQKVSKLKITPQIAKDMVESVDTFRKKYPEQFDIVV